MKLSAIAEMLEATVVSGDALLDVEIETAAASDLMSDILARVDVPDLLITRLNNAQVIRTASVFGIKAVIIVRGRPIDEKVAELAREEGIALLSSPSSSMEACGRLYAEGVRSAQPTAK
jgi:predicted transcriptional regulator